MLLWHHFFKIWHRFQKFGTVFQNLAPFLSKWHRFIPFLAPLTGFWYQRIRFLINQRPWLEWLILRKKHNFALVFAKANVLRNFVSIQKCTVKRFPNMKNVHLLARIIGSVYALIITTFEHMLRRHDSFRCQKWYKTVPLGKKRCHLKENGAKSFKTVPLEKKCGTLFKSMTHIVWAKHSWIPSNFQREKWPWKLFKDKAIPKVFAALRYSV